MNAAKTVASLLAEANTPDNTFIVITHAFSIVDSLPIDEVIILQKGEIAQKG